MQKIGEKQASRIATFYRQEIQNIGSNLRQGARIGFAFFSPLQKKTQMELRPLHCEFSVLQRADGSCRLKQGNTEVLAAIFGPTEPRGVGRKEDMNKAALKVLVYPCVGNPNPETTTLQYFLQNTFQEVILLALHPRTQIQIVVHILSDDGSV